MILRELRTEYEAAHTEQMVAYKSLQQERADARHQKHLAFACDTAWQMVGFAEHAIKYREEADGAKVPKALYRYNQEQGCLASPCKRISACYALSASKPHTDQYSSWALRE